jgi:hypothetical protein
VSLTWLTDLSVAAQKSGLVVHEVAGWQDRGHAHFTDVRGIVEHHTAGPKTGNAPSLGVVTRGRPGLDGPLANLLFARDASVFVVAAGVAWHAGIGHGYGFSTNLANYEALGIEAESTGAGDWTAAQLAAWPRLNNALGGHYGFPARMMIAHYEWTTLKIDPHGLPGGMTWLRAASARATSGGDDMGTVLYGHTGRGTTLAPGSWRVIAVSDAGAVSVAEGPARVTGKFSFVLDRPVGVRIESYVAKPDGKGGWLYYAPQGVADFVGGTAHEYTVVSKVPSGMRLRFRALQLAGYELDAPEPPARIIQAIYNLDSRS